MAGKLYFGGSFNPIHHGHLLCARAVAEAQGYQRVILVPSALPPHKLQTSQGGGLFHSLAPPKDRLEMCRRAVAGDPLFEVDDLELNRDGPSYTIDTARQLRAAAPKSGRIAWLIGADMVKTLPEWREPAALLEEVEFVIMARPDWPFEWNLMPSEFQAFQRQVVKAPLVDISASEIRRRVAEGRSIRYLCPDAVCDYIRDQKLYR